MSAQSPPGAESTLAHAGPNAWGEEEGDAWLEGASEKARQVGARVRRSELAPGQDSEGTGTQVRSAERAVCTCRKSRGI